MISVPRYLRGSAPSVLSHSLSIISPMLTRLIYLTEHVIVLLLTSLLLSTSAPRIEGILGHVRAITRPYEFNYAAWITRAAWIKLQQASLGMPVYLSRSEQISLVMETVRLAETIQRAEEELKRLFADPAITDKETATAHLRAELHRLNARYQQLAPIAESIVQAQVSQVLDEAGLTLAGQPLPPVLYHVSPTPLNLILSPRHKIEQIAAISLQTDLPLEEHIHIEERVAQATNLSTLVVPVGGIGVYPTMVLRTPYFTWQIGTVIHEWTHNFLLLRPLGMNYDRSPELRTMNETTASIVENELAPLVLARFYPFLTASLLDPQPAAPTPNPILVPVTSRRSPESLLLGGPWPRPGNDPSTFDFRAEMYKTRLHVDELLAAGKVEEAEAYMEERRRFFWENGYPIRKLNQAYFAFYGAYADEPGGPAGEDPVGPAVRALRAQSRSLAEFLYTIAWMDSFDDLLQAIGQSQPTSSDTP